MQGHIVYPSGQPVAWRAPYWIVALWGLLATAPNVTLRWLKRRPALAAVLGAICGPASFLAGVRLGGALRRRNAGASDTRNHVGSADAHAHGALDQARRLRCEACQALKCYGFAEAGLSAFCLFNRLFGRPRRVGQRGSSERMKRPRADSPDRRMLGGPQLTGVRHGAQPVGLASRAMKQGQDRWPKGAAQAERHLGAPSAPTDG